MSLFKMSRQVKFRAKSWYGNPPMWVEGYIYQAPGGWFMKFPAGNLMEINPDTIGQMTGIKDVDGKDVYEGDIVQFTKCESVTGEVVWNDDIAGFTLKLAYEDKPGSTSLGEWMEEGIKVIGNIHDNAEKS